MFCCYRLGQSGVLSVLRRQCFELDKATYIKGNSIEYFIMFMSCIHSVSILFSKKFPQLTMRKFIIHFSIVLPFLVSIFFQVLLNNTRSFRNPSYEGHPHMRDSFPSYEVPFFQNFEFVKLFLSSKFKLHQYLISVKKFFFYDIQNPVKLTIS